VGEIGASAGLAEPPEPGRPERTGRIGRLLREPAFRWWFASQLASSSGSAAQTVAQSWLIYQLTGRAVDLGLLAAVTWLPVLPGAALAGGLVDRVERRRLLVVTQVLFILVCGTQCALAAGGIISAWMLYLGGAFIGAISAVDLPARQVYVFELVGRGPLGNAIGVNEFVLNASRVVGPAVGGVLLATSGAAACFAVNTASFVPVLLVLLRFRPHHERSVPRPRVRSRDGWRYVRRSGLIWSCVLVAVAGGMLFNLGVAVPLLAGRVFHVGGGGYGAMAAAFGVGAVPAAILAATAGGAPSGNRVRALTVLAGLAVLATAIAPDVVTACVGIAVCGFLSIWLIAVANTLVQLEAAAEMRGRVMAVWTMALPGSIPFTALLTGYVAQVAGARAGFSAAGVVLLVVAVLTWAPLGGRDAAVVHP
jgi:MFS family permease